MKALVLDAPGTPDQLRRAELPIPEPAEGEIRVRLHAASLNPVDYKLMPNGNPAWIYPHIPGVDGAGIIDAAGPGAERRWKAGDRVYYHCNLARHGTYAEYQVVPAHTVAALPDEISFTDAAALPCAGLTAYLAIQRKLRVRAGQTVLVHGGAGGVGGFAVQLCRVFGARVFTTASAANHDFVRQLGAEAAIDYTQENVAARIRRLTDGLGVDAILNTVNRQTAQADLGMLAFGGELACIAGAPENLADMQPSNKSVSVHKLMLGGAFASGDRRAEADVAAMAEAFIALVRDGRIDPMVGEIIPLDEVPQALNRLAGRHVRGKIVVRLA